MAEQDITIEKVITAYLKLRGDKDRLNNETKTQIAVLDQRMSKLEAWLQQRMQVDGVDSYKTGAGTAFKTTTDHASVADWDAMIDFVKKNEAWHLLEKRVSKSAVRGYLEEQQPLPPGVNWHTRIDVNIRKPNRE